MKIKLKWREERAVKMVINKAEKKAREGKKEGTSRDRSSELKKIKTGGNESKRDSDEMESREGKV